MTITGLALRDLRRLAEDSDGVARAVFLPAFFAAAARDFARLRCRARNVLRSVLVSSTTSRGGLPARAGPIDAF